MKPRDTFRARRAIVGKKIWGCVGAALCLAAINAQAHDPFDCSSRLTIRDGQIEIVVTMGLDGARQLLAAAEFSAEQITETIRRRGPYSVRELPVALAARFFEVSSGEEKLTATGMGGLSDGTEVIFKMLYPRPDVETLQFRAVYFDAVEQMRPGAFIAYDENMIQRAAALLSPARVEMQVLLPVAKPATQSGLIATANISEPASNPTGKISSTASPRESAKPSPLRAWWFCAFPVVAVGAWFAVRKTKMPKDVNEF